MNLSEITKPIYRITEISKISGFSVSGLIGKEKKGYLSFNRDQSNRRYLTKEELIKFLKENSLVIDDSRSDVIYGDNIDLSNVNLDAKKDFLYLTDYRSLIEKVANKEVSVIYMSTLNDDLTLIRDFTFKCLLQVTGTKIILVERNDLING